MRNCVVKRPRLILYCAMILCFGLATASDRADAGDINSEFRMASAFGDLAKVEALLASGAEVNSRGPGANGVPPGGTALFLAAARNHVSVVKFLLGHGADPNIADQGGGTALIYTVWKGHSQIVELLLNSGADPNRAVRDGRTPLSIAQNAGRSDLIVLLKQYGAK